MIRFPAPALAILVALAVSGCNKAEETTEAEAVRPVLSVIAQPSALSDNGFAGTVEPRFSTNLGFRVLGRMIARHVDVGDTVKQGALIALLDATSFEFALEASKARLASAEAQLANARATETRQQTLLERSVATQADVDAALQARQSAEANVVRARADLAKAEEQLGYTRLTASFDGVVTAVGADVGQVVSAGETVATLARLDAREAVVDIPENVTGIVPGTRFVMTLQAFQTAPVEGAVREIAPEADEATRSRRVRISLDNPGPNFRLGATITARPVEHAVSHIDLPLSALLEDDGKTFVWVVEAPSGKDAPRTVSRREVTVSARTETSFRVATGIEAGTRVVSAGVHSLKADQPVTLYEETGQ